jgi:hypothetical protein
MSALACCRQLTFNFRIALTEIAPHKFTIITNLFLDWIYTED